jgi:hypothetical protein
MSRNALTAIKIEKKNGLSGGNVILEERRKAIIDCTSFHIDLLFLDNDLRRSTSNTKI